MKRILKEICGLAAMMCFILGGGENLDGSCNLPWSLGCIALCMVFCWACDKLSKSTRRHV